MFFLEDMKLNKSRSTLVLEIFKTIAFSVLDSIKPIVEINDEYWSSGLSMVYSIRGMVFNFTLARDESGNLTVVFKPTRDPSEAVTMEYDIWQVRRLADIIDTDDFINTDIVSRMERLTQCKSGVPMSLRLKKAFSFGEFNKRLDKNPLQVTFVDNDDDDGSITDIGFTLTSNLSAEDLERM